MKTREGTCELEKIEKQNYEATLFNRSYHNSWSVTQSKHHFWFIW